MGSLKSKPSAPEPPHRVQTFPRISCADCVPLPYEIFTLIDEYLWGKPGLAYDLSSLLLYGEEIKLVSRLSSERFQLKVQNKNRNQFSILTPNLSWVRSKWGSQDLLSVATKRDKWFNLGGELWESSQELRHDASGGFFLLDRTKECLEIWPGGGWQLKFSAPGAWLLSSYDGVLYLLKRKLEGVEGFGEIMAFDMNLKKGTAPGQEFDLVSLGVGDLPPITSDALTMLATKEGVFVFYPRNIHLYLPVSGCT